MRPLGISILTETSAVQAYNSQVNLQLNANVSSTTGMTPLAQFAALFKTTIKRSLLMLDDFITCNPEEIREAAMAVIQQRDDEELEIKLNDCLEESLP